MPELLTQEDRRQLEDNWRRQLKVKGGPKEIDFVPVVHCYMPFSTCRWWLTELEPGGDLAYGLCQITEAELGYVSIAELEEVRHPQGPRVIRDDSYRPTVSVAELARQARRAGGLLHLG